MSEKLELGTQAFIDAIADFAINDKENGRKLELVKASKRFFKGKKPSNDELNTFYTSYNRVFKNA